MSEESKDMGITRRAPVSTEATSTDSQRRRRVKVKAGQLVAIPLVDGTYALGHVARHYYRQATVAHFCHRASSPAKLLDGAEEAMGARPVAVLAVTHDEIYEGLWPVIGCVEPAYAESILDTKGTSYTASASRGLMNAWYGLEPWDGMADPRCHEKMLLPGTHVPPTVRYKRDFEQEATARGEKAPGAVVAADVEEQETPIREGPGEIHIEIKYEGEGLPTIPLLNRRQAIEDAITSAGVGDITDAGGGGGVMDIFVETQDVARALPVVHAAIQQAGFEDTAQVEVTPLDDEEVS